MSDPWEDRPTPACDLGNLAELTSQHYQQLVTGGIPADLAALLTRDLHLEATRRLLLDVPLPQPLTDLRNLTSCGWSKAHANRALSLHSPHLG